jgi:branched-subunit amino acid aminotransferase/4-amino-4-deoxychorismate lyase
MSNSDIAHFGMQAYEVFQLQNGVLFRVPRHTEAQLAMWKL